MNERNLITSIEARILPISEHFNPAERMLDEANSAESDDCVKEPYLPVKEYILVFGSMAVIACSSLFAWQYYLERSKRQEVVRLVDEIVVWQKENYAKMEALY